MASSGCSAGNAPSEISAEACPLQRQGDAAAKPRDAGQQRGRRAVDAALDDCEVQRAVDLLDIGPPIKIVDAVRAADDVRKAAAAEVAQQREVGAAVVLQRQVLPHSLSHCGGWPGAQLLQLHVEREDGQRQLRVLLGVGGDDLIQKQLQLGVVVLVGFAILRQRQRARFQQQRD